MPVVDLIAEQDQLQAHRYDFFLWPKLWSEYTLSVVFNWQVHPFVETEIPRIPARPGIYGFLVQPGIASFPSCSYLMYIGKTARTLRQRFKEYIDEKQRETGRPKIVRLLNKYQGYLYFCCSTVDPTIPIDDVEEALLNAFLPPCNDQFSAGVSRVIGAFQ
jgi:hypothetical protein